MSFVEPLGIGVVFGLANAAHCAGMCGMFALRAAAARRSATALGIYGLGKAFTYVFLGAMAGWLGGRLVGYARPAQAVLGILVAGVLILAGTRLLWWGAPASRWGTWITRELTPVLRALGSGRGVAHRFALGAVTGAVPCGVVYLAALQGAALGSPLQGVMVMAGLGLGTLPALAAVGLGGQRVLAWGGHRRLIRCAGGVLLLVAGVAALVRSLLPLLASDAASGTMPCCH